MTDDIKNSECKETETPEEQTLCQQLEESQAEAKEYRDKYLRNAAEFDNYRKRQERDRQLQNVRLRMEVMGKLLPILDDWDLALANVPGELESMSWVEGMALINRKMHTLISESGVTPFEALGEPFDPHVHAALMHEPSDEYAEGLVSEVLQSGYMLRDQVLRPAMVKVSAGPGPTSIDD